MTMIRISPLLFLGLCASGASVAACSSDDSTTPNATGNPDATTSDASSEAAGQPSDGGTDATALAEGSATSPEGSITSTGGPQTPPMGAVNVEAWLATGAYKQWAAEPAIHMARSPSPHGFNRIYSNTVISTNAAGTGAWPVGAAAVKELYNSAADTAPVGYAVYLKTQADSAGGANWYWYERVPLASTAAPHDDAGVVADGFGVPDGGPPTTICVGCHGAAGSDGPHTPSPGGRDEVYTPVHAQATDAGTD